MMTRRNLGRAAAAAAAAALTLGLTSAPASAGGTDSWSVIDNTDITNINRPGLARSGSSLDVVWTNTPGITASLYRRLYSATGAAGAVTTLIAPSEGWNTLNQDPVRYGSMVAAAGIKGNPADPGHWPGNAFGVNPAGTLFDTLSTSESAYASQGQDIAVASGAPLYTFTDAGQVVMHIGTGFGSDWVVANGGCCAYAPAVEMAGATDGWVAWYSNSSTPSQRGWLVSHVTGLPWSLSVGAAQQAPGALTGGDALSASQRSALARRPNGEVWLAYPVGYPTAKKIRVWKLGSPTYVDVKVKKSLRHVALSADSAGRLWLSYALADSHKVAVVRSNAAVTAFGSPNAVAVPGSDGAYSTAIEANPGSRADVVVNSGTAIHHRQFLPALTAWGDVLKIKNNGTVKFRVWATDATEPLAGAKVKVKGIGKETTGPGGKATFFFPKAGHKKVQVTVKKPGYLGASFTKKVKAP